MKKATLFAYTFTLCNDAFSFMRMSCILAVCNISLFITPLYAAQFTSLRSGAWNDPCTWANPQGCPTSPPTAVIGVNIPGPNDDVMISNKHVVAVTSDAYVNNLTIDNGTGNNTTLVNIIGDLSFVVLGKLIVNQHGSIVIDGGAYVNVKGDICVKNNGNIAVKGVGPTADGYFFVEGCSTSGSTNCDLVDSKPPTFINGEYLIRCIACKGNSSTIFEGTQGACNLALPVDLIYFKASFDKNNFQTPAVALSWLTASEKDNNYFTVERSTDARSFEPLARIEGSGTTTYHALYEYQDYNPLPNVSYYRIRQTDTDGKSTFSKIVAVEVPAEEIGLFTLAPNPFDGREVQLYFASSNAMWIEIVDAYGNKIDKKSYSLESSTSQAKLRFHQPLKKGLYYLELGLDERRTSGKFIVY